MSRPTSRLVQQEHAQLLFEVLVRLGLDECGLEFSGRNTTLKQDVELIVRPVLHLGQAEVAPYNTEQTDGEPW